MPGCSTTLAADSGHDQWMAFSTKRYSAAWRAYNATDAPIPHRTARGSRFAAQVAPGSGGAGRWSAATRASYADLDRRADAVRAALVQRGVSAGELVPSSPDGGWQQIPAVLRNSPGGRRLIAHRPWRTRPHGAPGSWTTPRPVAEQPG